ncbi:aminoacyl-histidine dipeptidase [Vallitalea longa]|uniref:Cytosol non-specific dipeptidase n=1 Tax=Vallitalea longa TaxID=2936439 RepID=A0A9W5Y9W8_9FIRM|nr:aminoacyl-histidine dipeptidase [Vallitalea longa]GKX30007.1 aminoacyl-histidine dipeptidase [Vallitalea longa]
MSKVIEGLEPKSVFEFFENISDIPRGSGNEKGISDYLVSFAKERNLEVIQDEELNVIIKKPATKGYEDCPTVILQGHMDMVCEKNFDVEHDFLKDPIELVVEGDFISANGTTLGADNGMAVAYCLAILDSNKIEHPALEIFITTNEEAGMNGALALDPANLSGKYLVNLDSEEEGEFLVSCAGGLKTYIDIPIKKESATGKIVKIMVKGLKGGHSGSDIDKNRANSNQLMGRILYALNTKTSIQLIDICGGSKDNAIPREAIANIVINDDDNKFDNIVDEIVNEIKHEYKTSDSGLTVVVTKGNEDSYKVVSRETLDKLIFLLTCLPNGIQTMSSDIEGLVESSLNLGVVTTNDDIIKLTSAVRSSVGSLKELMKYQLGLFAKYTNSEFHVRSEYPEWEYRKESQLRDIFAKTYEDMYGEKPLIKAIHAGLECGVFDAKIEGIDMISLGPNMYDVHTPDEKLSISSTRRTWEFLIETLKNIK